MELTDEQKSLLSEARRDPKIWDVIEGSISDGESTSAKWGDRIAGVQSEVVMDQVYKAMASDPATLTDSSADSHYDVQLRGLRKLDDGSIVVATADNQTADPSEVEYSNKGQAIVFESYSSLETAYSNPVIANMPMADRSALAMGYDPASGMDGRLYVVGSNEAYWYGYEGISLNTLPSSSFAKSLPAEVVNRAYALGRAASATSAKAQNESVQSVYEQAVKKLGGKEAAKAALKKTGEVVLEHGIRETSMTKKQKASYELAEVVAKTVGTNIHVYSGSKGNGYYDPKTGEIWLNINADHDGESVMAYTLGHELAHMAKDWQAEKFKAFADLLLEKYGEKGISVEALIQAKIAQYAEHGITIDEHEAYEEVIADACQAMLLDTNAVENMAAFREENPSLWQKIVDTVKKFIAVIRKALEGAEPDSTEAHLFMELEAEAKKTLENLFVDMVMDAGRKQSVIRAAGMLNKNTASKGGVRNKIGGMTRADIQAVQSIGRRSVNSFTSADIKATERFARQYWSEMGIKSPFFRAWFGDWRVGDQSPVQIADKQGNTRGVQKNVDTGWSIQISGQVFNETRAHNAKANREAMAYLPFINDIVKKAVLLDSYGQDIGKAKSANSLLMHSMYAVADIGNGPEVLKLYVEEMNDPNAESTSKRAYQLQNIEKAFNASVRVQGNAPSSLTNTSNAVRTVADLFSAVKQKDSRFNPNPVSVIVDSNGKPKKVYHGSAELFHAFSYGHIGRTTGSGILGDGFYFTDKSSLAKRYGDNLYTCYLRMRKPYHATESDAYTLNATKLQQQGYDGVILSAPSGEIYMVIDNTQIKSATDNIGTFDGSNPDIRYSMPKVKSEESFSSYQEPAYQEWDVQVALYDALDHTDKGQDNLIRVGNMPRFIVDRLGIEGDFYIYRNHAYENMVTGEQAKADGRFSAKAHYHGLGIETMTDAVMGLENPIMTIATKTKDGNPAVITLLPVEGKNKAPLYAVLSFYSSKDINGDYSRKPHVVLTIAERNYIEEGGRAGIADVVNSAVRDGRVISFDENKRDYLTVNTKATSLGIISEQSLADNLARFRKEIKSFREKNHITYKAPSSSSLSPRQLLANVSDDIAQTPEQRNLMAEYRNLVAQAESVHDRLRKIRGKIRDLKAANGDKAQIAELNKTAEELAKMLDKYNRKLRKIETTQPMMDVVKRAQAIALEEGKRQGEVLMAEYRQKVGEKFDTARKKLVETREKRQAREKLQKLVLDTVSWLTYPKKNDVKCPDFLKKPYEDFLRCIDLSSQRLGKGGDPTKADLRLANAMGSLATVLERVMISQDPSQDAATVLDVGYLDLPAPFVQKLRDMTENIKKMMVDGG